MGELDDLTNEYNVIADGLGGHSISIANTAITNSTLSGIIAASTSVVKSSVVDHILDKYELNRVAVDHKVTEAEIMKLKEVAPDYVNEIKEKISREMARDIIKKTTFTKRKDEDTDVNHFIGRVWVFTEAELKDMIKEIQNA
jgi:hypothetical protein